MRSKAPRVSEPLSDRRAQSYLPADSLEDSQSGAPRYASSFISGFRFKDILSSHEHTEDFKDTRAEYILVRARFMAFFFAVAVPLWIPIDYFTLSAESFLDVTISRFLLSAVFLVLGLAASFMKRSYVRTYAFLFGVMVSPVVFYAYTMHVLSENVSQSVLIGYTFMPYLIIAMLAVYPMTLIGSCCLMGMVFVIALVTELSLNSPLTFEVLNKLWLFTMFSGITLWIQSGQLLMLLKLYRESTMDPLTGLINRRVLMKRLKAEVDMNRHKGRCFSVLMFDLDRFKRVNDQYGHLTGDLVLKAAASLLKKQIRDRDILARFGGEEFTAVLPGVTGAEAVVIAERIRIACQQAQIEALNGELLKVSTSVGVTEYESGELIDATISRVDDLLYKAKELGRNRVVYSQSTDDLSKAGV